MKSKKAIFCSILGLEKLVNPGRQCYNNTIQWKRNHTALFGKKLCNMDTSRVVSGDERKEES